MHPPTAADTVKICNKNIEQNPELVSRKIRCMCCNISLIPVQVFFKIILLSLQEGW